MSDRLDRFIVNDDGSTFLCNADSCGPQELKQYLTEKYANREIDTIAFCATFGAGNCYYNSSSGNRYMALCEPLNDFLVHRVQKNFSLFDQAGLDYFGHAIHILRQLGVKRIASIRMNDCHASFSPYCRSAFWMAHPEYRLGTAARGEYYAAGLNFALPEVRLFFGAQIKEIIGMFPDLDGIELDFNRSPFFFAAGQEEKSIPLMNELLLGIRSFLNNLPRKYRLEINVPGNPELCRQCGLDVVHWIQQGWIDRVATGFYLASPDVPISAWRSQIPDTFPLYCYTNCSQQYSQYQSLENYLAIAANCFASGGNGLYLFNFCCYDEISFMSPKDPTQSPYPPPAAPARQTLPDLDKTRTILSMKLDKKTLDRATKHFQFLMSPEYQVHFPPGPLIWKRSQKTLRKTFFCQSGNQSEVEAILQWLITAVTPEDVFVFSLNGTPLYVERQHFYKGRDARLHPEKLPPYSAFSTRLPDRLLLNGYNLFEAQFCKQEQSLNLPVELRELELKISPAKKSAFAKSLRQITTLPAQLQNNRKEACRK